MQDISVVERWADNIVETARTGVWSLAQKKKRASMGRSRAMDGDDNFLKCLVLRRFESSCDVINRSKCCDLD